MPVYNIQITVDSKGAVKGLKTVERQTDKTTKRMAAATAKVKALRSQMAAMGKVALGAGAAFGAMFLRDSIRKANEQEMALAAVASQIEATGGAAGFSAKQIAEYASELQRMTGIGDEEILRMNAVMLSFKNIGGEAFERLSALALDVSTVMGQDMKTSALMLAKALADPVARLGELSRSGIIFTQVQKDMVKEMVEAGRLMEAQAFILDEIESQYGGAAVAARDTLGGAIRALKSEFGDLQEMLILESGSGGAMRTAVETWVKWLRWLKENWVDIASGVKMVWNSLLAWFTGLAAKFVGVFVWLNEAYDKLPWVDPSTSKTSEVRSLQKDLEALAEVFADAASEAANLGKSGEDLDDSLRAPAGLAGGLEETSKAAEEAAAWMEEFTSKLEKAKVDRFVAEIERIVKSVDTMIERIEEGQATNMDWKPPPLEDVMPDEAEYLKRTEKMTEQSKELWVGFARDVQREFGNAIYEMLDGNLKSFEDFFSSVFDMFKQLIARMIAHAVANKILVSIGFGGGVTGGAGGGLLGGLFGGGSGAAFMAGLKGVSGGGLANAVGLGLAAAAPVLGIAVAAALLKANKDAQDRKKTIATGSFYQWGEGFQGNATSYSGHMGTAAELDAAMKELVGIFESIEESSGASLELVNRLKVNVTGHGKNWAQIWDETGRLLAEAQFDKLEDALRWGAEQLLARANVTDASQAIAEVLSRAVSDGLELTLERIETLTGVDQAIADAMGFKIPEADPAIQKLEELRKAIETMGLTAEAAAPYLEQISAAEQHRMDVIETDLLGTLFKYFEGTAKYEKERMELAKRKVELEFAVIRAQLEAAGLWEEMAQVWREALGLAKGAAAKAIRIQPVSIVEDLTAGDDAAHDAWVEQRKRRQQEVKDLIKVLQMELGIDLGRGGRRPKTSFQLEIQKLIDEMNTYYTDEKRAIFEDYIRLLKEQRKQDIMGQLLEYVKEDEKWAAKYRQWQEAQIRIEFEIMKADLITIGAWAELADLWTDALNGALDALDDTIDSFGNTANAWESALQSLKDFRSSLYAGSGSPYGMSAQLQMAKTNFQQLLAAALGGDATAAGQLPQAAQALLDLARNLYGSTSQYRSIFDFVMSGIEAAIGVGEEIVSADANHIADKVDESLREQTNILSEDLHQLGTKVDRVGDGLDDLNRRFNDMNSEMRLASIN